jgi:hypothetical protein
MNEYLWSRKKLPGTISFFAERPGQFSIAVKKN